MKKILTVVICTLTVLLAQQSLFAQCNTDPCPGGPQWSTEAADACINGSSQALSCYFGQTVGSGPSNVQPPFWCTTIENNQFFAFVADMPNVTFEIEALNCASGGAIQAAILSTPDCNSFNFVSDCLGNIASGTTQTLTNTTPLVPGTVYYLMIDGSAGANCNFAINGSSVITQGPEQVCIPSTAPNTYTTNNPSVWEVVPAGGGIISNPVGTSTDITFTAPGVYQVCAKSTICPNVPPYCITVTVGQNTMSSETAYLCNGESVSCGGQTYNTPGSFSSTIPNSLGCDSIITCNIIPIPPIITNLPPVTLCAPEAYWVCGQIYNYSTPISQVCESWQGCDSTVNVNLTILEPIASIAPPTPIGCGVDSLVYLDGTASTFNFYGTTTWQWTGPGIEGPTNSVLALVTEPGEYCLTVTHAANGVSCSDEECVTVGSNIQLPSPPSIAGPNTVCSGGTSTYSLTPMGSVIPAGYTWTVPAGATFTNGPNNSIIVNWGTSTGGQVCVVAYNNCGQSAPACINVTVNAGPPAPTVTGPPSVCSTGGIQTFSIGSPVPGINYIWTVPTGATFTGSGASIQVDFDGVANGTVQVCAASINNCDTSAFVCANVIVTGPPTEPILSGPSNVCASSGPATFTVTNPQTGVTYTWSAPPNAVISGSGTSVTIDFATANSGQVCVTASNGCGMPSDCMAVTVTPAPTAVISGSGEFCQGSGGTVNLTITLTGTGPWVVVYSNGTNQFTENISASPFTLPATVAGTYTLVSVTGAGNCTGTVSGTGTVTQNPLPTATLNGNGTICQGSGTQVPLTVTCTGEAPWTVGWQSGTNAQSPLTVPASPFNLPIGQNLAGNITLVSVVDNNGCIGTVGGASLVEVFGAPSVTNIVTQCDPTNTTYVVTFNITGGDAASYFVTPANGALSGGTFTSNPIPTGSGYSFVIDDANSCNPVTVEDPIVICDCATAVGTMSLDLLSNCGPGTVTPTYDATNEALDGNDVQVFILHNGSSGNIVPPILSTSTSPDVTFDPATMAYGTTYYLSAVVGDGDGTGGVNLNDPCLAVAQGTPIVFYELPTASMAGSTAICVGNPTSLQLTLTGASPWSVTINGQQVSNIFASPYDFIVNPDTTTTYILTAVQDDRCSNTATGTETIEVNDSPVVSGLEITCNPTGTAYTVCFNISEGDPSCYQVSPLNGTITGNQFCSNPIPDGQGFSFVVSDCNNCPSVTVEQAIVDCSCLSEAGDLDLNTIIACGSEVAQGIYTDTDEFLDADDVLCFVLHAGNPLQPIATNPTPEFSFIPGVMQTGQTYYMCPAVATDDGTGCVDFADPCISFGDCTPVVFRSRPQATIGSDASICLGESATLTLQMTASSPWTVTYQDDSGNQTMVDVASSPFTFPVSPTATTTYTLVSINNQFCPGDVSGMATVEINTPPTATLLDEVCNASATTYAVSFEINGGVPGTYTINPSTGALNGNVFTSAPIPSATNYSFLVDDVNGCGPVEVAGLKNCNCITDAGTMSAVTVEFCIDELGTVSLTVGDTLDANDILIYALHTGSGASLGTVIATSPTPSFPFDPATMMTGVTYYISAVAGDDDGNGNVDLTDGCLDVAQGTPIVFNPLPTVAIAGTATLCEGQSTDVTFTLTGEGPFSVAYTINGAAQTPLVVPTPGTFTVPVSPTASATYTLVSITDQGTGCTNTASQSATITLNPTAVAGSATGNFEFCDDVNQTINLNTLLAGADPGGEWTDPNGEVIPGGTFNVSFLSDGTYLYTYTVAGTAPCPDDAAQVEVIINPLPVADAGQDLTLDCDLSEGQLGGNGNTPGVSFEWTGNVSDPTAQSPTTTEPGTYVLTVTTLQGCIATDEVVVDVNNIPPIPHITVSDVSCFGETDGFITIDSITSGQAPFLCSFDGGPFTSLKSFTELSPGTHSLVIVDASGCETTVNFTVAEPEEVVVQIEGNFEGNPIVDLGDPLVLEIITNPPFQELDTVIWTPSDIVPCDTCQTNTIFLEQQTTFSVTIDEGGCQAEDDITVFVRKKRPVYVPNAFSPNGDGTNDFLLVYSGKEVAKVRSFLVFSRWGETIYQYYNFPPNDPAYGWDGLHRGEPLDPAVFTWFAEIEFIDGKTQIFEGDVTLVR